MRKSRVSSSSSKAVSKRVGSQNQLKLHRFIGVSLGGGKSERTSVAVLDYYSDAKKLFLTHIYDKIGQENDVSSDQILFEIISENSKELEYLVIDAPLKFPKCLRCNLKCPGYEKCKEPEILWMWKEFQKIKRKKKNARLFTPYTQRCSELYFTTNFDEPLLPQEAVGANIAPLTARAHFLVRRLKGLKTIEAFPKLTVLRMGQALNISKTHLGFYKHQVGGDESRLLILNTLIKHNIAFIYQQDINKMVENPSSFDAFIGGLTGFLKFIGLCEKPAEGFPLRDGWVEVPKSPTSIKALFKIP